MKQVLSMTMMSLWDVVRYDLLSYTGRLRVPDTCPPDVAVLLGFLNEHLYDEALTTAWARRRCGLADNNIHGRFAHYVGRTPGQYVTEHRLEASKRLLMHRELKVVEIAHLLGYATHGAYTQAFRRRTGLTPTEYRNNLVTVKNAVKKDREEVVSRAPYADR
jgi:AraC-like DNA-binding protein